VITTAINAAFEKKALNLVVAGPAQGRWVHRLLRDLHGRQSRQMAAIADGVREALKQAGERPVITEGTDASAWMLLDYFNFVVHVFSRECRAFYDLERLWGNATRHEVFPPDAAPASAS
jgi:ribosome-associated protein